MSTSLSSCAVTALLLLAPFASAEDSAEQVRLKAVKKAQEALLGAAKGGDVVRVADLLQNGTDVNARDGAQRTPLLLAARGGHLAVVRALAAAGAALDARDEDGRTALMEAARRKDALPALALVGAGADVNLADADGWTALMHAVKDGTLAAGRCRSRPRRASQTSSCC